MAYRPNLNLNLSNSQFKRDRTNTAKFLAKLFVIFGLPIIALLIVIFLIRIYHISGPSMEPTFKDGERVLIEKWDKTYARFTGKKYAPDRFDVVVLKLAEDEPQVIKRVIGLPGEQVIVEGNSVTIINGEYPEGYLVDKDAPVQAKIAKFTSGTTNLSLGEDEIFVLGDNRPHSEDSRHYGAVPIDKVVGKFWSHIGF